MATYFEPTSGVGNSTAELIDHAPNADVEELAGRRGKARAQRAPVERRTARFFRQAIARPEDGIPAGTCARCGCVGNHAKLEDCVDALRDWIAELTCAEVRTGRAKLHGG